MELIMAQHPSSNTSNPSQASPDVLFAAYALGQRNNISELARRLGKGATILANKLNPDCDTHHLSLGEAVAITELTNDSGIMSAWALSRGQMLVDMPEGAVCDDDLVEQVLLVQAIFGELMREIHDARRDGVIDRLEQSRIESIGRSAAQQVIGLITTTGANVRELNTGRG
jgi:hypothetical protein